MARKTAQELNEARRKKAEERKLQEEEEEARLEERDRQHRERVAREQDLQERHSALDSFVKGIYEEASKLSSKRAIDPMSERMVDRTNRAIRSARDLLAGESDPFIDEIEEFVPAGDEVEARDVVLTLRQIRDALDRMEKRHHKAWHPYPY